MQHAFHWMGIAILLTTELGLLDACARISTDIIKVNWLRDSEVWTDSRLYFLLLWGQILLGCAILLAGLVVPGLSQPLVLLVLSASLNGGVMLIYSLLLLWMNSRVLGGSLRTPVVRFLAMVWASAFFGYFTIVTFEQPAPEAVRGRLTRPRGIARVALGGPGCHPRFLTSLRGPSILRAFPPDTGSGLPMSIASSAPSPRRDPTTPGPSLPALPAAHSARSPRSPAFSLPGRSHRLRRFPSHAPQSKTPDGASEAISRAVTELCPLR